MQEPYKKTCPTKTELLAPAGNYESFLGAIHAGADAVYLAGQRFGARAYADNFSIEELCRAIRYAHLSDRKVYLTLNTLVKESEFSEIYAYLKPFYEEGLDGIIIQDMGVFAYVRKEFPGLPLHISTQSMVTGAAGAGFLKEQGAVRIVPARELSLSEIRRIKEETGLELETFIHGAMCYCYSGQCLFSSIAGGRSGNRGRCAQPCRLPYQLYEKRQACFPKESYPLSLKDLCTIQDLPALLTAGIDSFKIEGRMKKPEYAAGVTAIYRKYMDRIFDHPEKEFQVEPADLQKLSSLYIRSEVQNGYYFRQNGREMITLTSPAYSGSDEMLLEAIHEEYVTSEKKVPISLHLVCKVGKPLQLTLEKSDSDICITVEGTVVDRAAKQPVKQEILQEKITQFGTTFFEVKECQIDADPDCFVPVKVLKELRRLASEQLEDAILKQKRGTLSDTDTWKDSFPVAAKKQCRTGFSVLVSSREQLQECIQRADLIDRIYLESSLLDDLKKKIIDLKEKQDHLQIFIALPFVLREKDESYIANLMELLRGMPIDGFLVRNVEELGILKGKYMLALDAGMYGMNQEAVTFYAQYADSFCLPYELNFREKKQQMDLTRHVPYEQVVYGRIPMMVTANCLARTAGKCNGKEKDLLLTDRYQHKFPVQTICGLCYNIIWNCLPLSLHKNLSGYQNCMKRLQFTTESGCDTGRILDYFLKNKGASGESFPINEYTAGHEKRGVE